MTNPDTSTLPPTESPEKQTDENDAQSQTPRNRRDLDDIIENNEWDAAMERFRMFPEEARQIVNPSLGWTKLHYLCSIGAAPTEIIDLVAQLYPEAISMADRRYGDTPLHILCRNSQTSAQKVKILLRHLKENDIRHQEGEADGETNFLDGVLIRNRFGGTPLHSAANHNAVLEVLQELVAANPRILRVTTHEGTHAVSALWHSYIQTIPGYMIVARILEGEDVRGEGHFERFWKKVEFLATEYYRVMQSQAQKDNTPDQIDSRFVLHGLIKCNVAINCFKVALKWDKLYLSTPDSNGNLALHRILEDRPFRLKEREAIQSLLEVYPEAASHRNEAGAYPLTIAIENRIPFENGVGDILNAYKQVVHHRDHTTSGLYPFQLAAAVGGKVGIETTFHLLLTKPDLLSCFSENRQS